MTENQIGTIVIEAAIAVHREPGPGLLETVYEVILARELGDRGLKIERQVPVPIQYNFGEDVMKTGITRCVTSQSRLIQAFGQKEKIWRNMVNGIVREQPSAM